MLTFISCFEFLENFGGYFGHILKLVSLGNRGRGLSFQAVATFAKFAKLVSLGIAGGGSLSRRLQRLQS